MERKLLGQRGSQGDRDALDLKALLNPASAFGRPADVLADLDLTLREKRAILASWASDACALEAVPALFQPTGKPVVRFDEIADALRELDRLAADGGAYRPRPHYRRVLDQRMPGVFGRKARPGGGQGLPN